MRELLPCCVLAARHLGKCRFRSRFCFVNGWNGTFDLLIPLDFRDGLHIARLILGSMTTILVRVREEMEDVFIARYESLSRIHVLLLHAAYWTDAL